MGGFWTLAGVLVGLDGVSDDAVASSSSDARILRNALSGRFTWKRLRIFADYGRKTTLRTFAKST